MEKIILYKSDYKGFVGTKEEVEEYEKIYENYLKKPKESKNDYQKSVERVEEIVKTSENLAECFNRINDCIKNGQLFIENRRGYYNDPGDYT